MTTASFDLTEQPWILVLRLDGTVEEVSIRQLVARAHEFRQIVGELPTQAFALVRMLLAILHRAVEGPETTEHWAELWRAPTLPTSVVDEYLDHFRDRFDLLSSERPFYQVADLRTAKDEVFSLDRLIADVPTGARYFTTRLGEGIARVSFAEAARWVVHCHAFDPSGIKSADPRDRRAKNGRGYPIGTGWAGNLGGVLVEGDNLKETLLLQLIPDDIAGVHAEDDLPVWERDEAGAEEVEGGREPTGPLDLYTWQTRRVRLFPDGDGVYGVLITNGDKITPQNMHRHEPMSAWRRSETQEKKLKTSLVYMPRTHAPERSVWRGLGGLLPATTVARQGSEGAGQLPPLVLQWVATAAEHVGIGGRRLRTRVIGMEYGSHQATTTEVVDDSVLLAAALLSETDPALGAAAADAAADAESGAWALGELAGELAEAGGGERTGPRDRAREDAYGELDRPFRQWLARIGPGDDPDRVRTEWQQTAQRIIAALGDELVARASPAAWRGRSIERNKKEEHVSTPTADLRFRGRLRHRVFPLAYQSAETEVMA